MKTVKRKAKWPKWANYKATDENGEVNLYNHKPKICPYDTQWLCNDIEVSRVWFLEIKQNNNNWKKSLRKIED